jgi:wyosine [tRNA(Phe)-imidazoG37] synthetase (radical SAM superfamily)
VRAPSRSTLVPNGEPTLDKDLGAHIRALAEVGIPVAVVTNASLLWMPEVRANLGAADLVSVKVDATQGDVWRRLNRPHGHLELGRVLDGIRAFAQEYSGELISETMLVRSFNDNVEDVTGTAEFLADIAPARAYIGVPTRPPASRDATPPSDFAIVRAYEIMKSRLEAVEILPLHETGVFGRSDDPVEGLLAILAVHPMREAAVLARMEGTEADPQRLEALIREGRVSRVEYRGVTFLVRRVVS